MSLVGRRLVGLELVEELGGGSVATVYRARDVTGAPVSVKVMHPFLAGNPRLLERFRREARVAAELAHPRIVPFRGAWEVDGLILYAMAFLPMPTVEDLLDELQRIPVRMAARILADAAEALHFAHQRGVVHRDLKPSNLFWDRAAGHAILSDFGLAKLLHETPITAERSKMMGTPYYMAPEQVRGEETSPSTDVYQAGLVLFELLTGRRPFEDESVYQTIMRRCSERVLLDEDELEFLPEGVVAVIERATQVQPEDRYSSAAELAEALAPWAGSPGAAGAAGTSGSSSPPGAPQP